MVKNVETDDPDEINEFELVHLAGQTLNNMEIVDQDFGIIAHNSYRLKRKVEMYQWREIVESKDDRKSYRYDAVWSESRIDSSSFHEHDGHENPKNSWPFQSNTLEAQNVTLGKF